MIQWRRLSFLLSTNGYTKPLHIVPRQSTFYPSRSFTSSPTTTTTTTTNATNELTSRSLHRPKIKKLPSSTSKPPPPPAASRHESIKKRSSSPSFKRPVSTQEKAVQQSIASRRLDQAKRQLMDLQDSSTTLHRFNTWRPLLLLARKGRHPRDLAWLQDMVERQGMTRQWNLTPDLFDMHALMYCYGVHGDLAGAEHTFNTLLPAMGLTPSVFTINTLLGCYQRNKAIDKALQLLEQQPSQLLDIASYNTVLAMLDVDQQWTKVIHLYQHMPMNPDRYTFTTMLHVATQTNNSGLGLPIYQQLYTMLQHIINKSNITTTERLDITTVNAMMTFQVSVMNDVDTALDIYQQLCTNKTLTPDTITCNVILDGLLNQRRNPGKTAAMIHQMEARGHLLPDHVTYGIMMEAEVMMGDLRGCLDLFEAALDIMPTTNTNDNRISTIERMMACLARATATLDHDQSTMEHLWNILATTTTKSGYTLDVKAYNGLMHGLAKLGRADLAQMMYDRVFRMHSVCVADVATFTSLMLAYINNDQIDDAMEIYYVLREQHYKQQQQKQQIRRRRPVITLDTVFYTTLISALTDNKNDDMYHLNSALELFMDMRQLRIQPTIHTYTAMLHWCGRHGDLEGLEEVHQLIKMDMGLDPDVGIYNALMDGYNRTDQIDQVLYLWDMMLTTSTGIDQATVSIILDACGHHHQPQRAKMIWAMLLHRQDFQLNTNNYNSYVECLCRVGDVNEKKRWRQAMEVVQTMLRDKQQQQIPVPNSKTLNTLASFARKYGLNNDKEIREQLDALKLELQKRSLLD